MDINYFHLLIGGITLSVWLASGGVAAEADTSPPPDHDQTLSSITQTIGNGYGQLEQGQHEQATATAQQAEQAAQQALAALPTPTKDNTQQKQQAELNLALALTYQLQSQIDWRQGLALQFRDEYAKAEPLLKHGLEMAQKSLTLTQANAAAAHIKVGQAPLLVSGQMLALAESYQQQGRHNEATTLLAQCQRLLESLPGQLPDTWSTQADLARLYVQQGNPSQAETLLTDILHQLPPDHEGMATVLQQLGRLYQEQGNYPQAAQAYQQSRDKSPDKTHAALPLASLYMDQADYTHAEPLLTDLLAQLTKPPAQGSTALERQLQPTLLAATLNMQGRNDTQLGKYAEAAASFQQNIANGDNLPPPASPGSKASSYAGLAKVQGLQQNIPAALALVQQAWEQYATHPTTGTEHTNGQRQLARQHLWLLQRGLAWQQTAVDTTLQQAFIALQQAHGTGRMEILRQTALRMTANNASTRAALQHLWQEQHYLQRLDQQYAETLATPDSANTTLLTEIKQAMQQSNQTIRQLDTQLQTRFPAYTCLLNPTPLPLEQAQALLQADEALLAWGLGEGDNNEHSWLMLLRPDHPLKLYALDVNPKILQTSLNDPANGLLGAMGNPQKPFNLDTAHTLYQQLLAPAEADLAGVKHILAVPDGLLHNLPLHLLVKTQPTPHPSNPHGNYAQADWLARHYAIAYLPSVHALADLRSHSAQPQDAARQPFIGIGAPHLSGDNAGVADLFAQLGERLQRGDDKLDFFANTAPLTSSLRPLPDTATELATIANLLQATPATALLLDKDATETRIKQMSQSGKLRQSRILSFATHALLPPTRSENPLLARLEPGLVLTPTPQGSATDDGYLTASEIAGLELDADWVLLSACNTGTLSATDTANGLSALSRAFFAAGARGVLASHWAVESTSTTRLMTQLFSNLQQDKRLHPAEALRQSMLAMLTTPAECGLLCWLGWQDAPQPAHPAYWGAFVMYGG